MRFKIKDRWDWHKWFAWYPVKTECDTWVWLETVERKVNTHYDRWEQRRNDNIYRIPE